jgi:hypothetical protein
VRRRASFESVGFLSRQAESLAAEQTGPESSRAERGIVYVMTLFAFEKYDFSQEADAQNNKTTTNKL